MHLTVEATNQRLRTLCCYTNGIGLENTYFESIVRLAVCQCHAIPIEITIKLN